MVTSLRDEIAARRTIADEVISLANLLGRPVVTASGQRVGTLDDVAVHWNAGTTYTYVSGVLVSVNKGLAFVNSSDVTIEQSKVRMRSTEFSVAGPVRQEGDIALARDVLDRQLVDVEGVQVVRAADVYLRKLSDGWELAGVDVGFQAYARRLLRKRRRCPSPHRAVDWADLQTFVPRSGEAPPDGTSPAAAAGNIGGGLQLGSRAKELHKLNAKDVAGILSDLGRREQVQVASLATPSTAAEAIRAMSPKHRDALLAELNEEDRARLLALLDVPDPT